VDHPIYAVCEHCAFLRAFGRSASGSQAPERCPACGHEIRVHGRRERFPSAYVSRISRNLHHTPPLNV
jgi:DNA-directed RNA polymerase subunit RPC12/RpoP